MTEGTPAPLAVWQDVQSRWRPLSTAEQDIASTRIAEATALLRLALPDIDERAAADPNLAVLVVGRIADAVLRTLTNPERAKQVQETIGPRSYALSFDTSSSGVYFTDDELAPLQPTTVGPSAGAAALGIGTASVGIRPGWGPPGMSRRGAGWW